MTKTLRSHLPLLSILMLGVFLAILNQTLLNVAIPKIMSDFSTSASTVEWLLTGYMLVNGILVPLSAYLIERFGLRPLFIFAMACFTGGSLVCSLAPTFAILLIGRLIQAVGGGILMPLVMTTILTIFPPEERGKGMGIFGLGIIFAPALGPTLSGWIIEHYNWRILFDGIVPLGLIILLLSFLWLQDIQPPKKELRFDLWGSILSSLGFGFLLYGLSEAGSKGWDDSTVLTTIVLGSALVVFFVLQQLSAREPMLDFRIFRYDMFTLSNVITAITTISMFGAMFLLPIYLQNLRGFSPLESGLLMLPGALMMGILSPLSGSIFDRFGPRPLAIVGMVIALATTYEFTQLTLETSYTEIITLYMIRSIGLAFLMMPIMTAAMNQLPVQKNSHGTAMSNTIRQVMGSFGISLMTTIFSQRMNLHLVRYSEHANTMDPGFLVTLQELINKLMQTAGLSAQQAQETALTLLYSQIQKQAAVAGINDAFWWMTGLNVVGLILCFWLRDVRKDTKLLPHPSPKKHSAEEEQTVENKKLVSVP